jgi:hypothetical protein
MFPSYASGIDDVDMPAGFNEAVLRSVDAGAAARRLVGLAHLTPTFQTLAEQCGQATRYVLVLNVAVDHPIQQVGFTVGESKTREANGHRATWAIA